jgi:prevent-host-death family protein
MPLASVTATDARVHFGEILQRVAQNDETILVERAGKPIAVILPVERYDRMRQKQADPDWRDLLKDAHDHIRAAMGGQALTPPEEMIRLGRDARDAEQLGLP